MTITLIANNPCHAQMIGRSLRNHNIDCQYRHPRRLQGFEHLEGEAIVITGDMPEHAWKQLKPLLKHQGEIPIVFQGRQSELPSDKVILKKLVVINPSASILHLIQVIHTVTEIQRKRNRKRTHIQAGKLELYQQKRMLVSQGSCMQLTKKEYYLLEILIKNRDNVTLREHIIDYVWDRRSFVAANTIEVYISRLRKILKDLQAPCAIKAVPSLGYTFSVLSQ